MRKLIGTAVVAAAAGLVAYKVITRLSKKESADASVNEFVATATDLIDQARSTVSAVRSEVGAQVEALRANLTARVNAPADGE